jgi:hypothetical protein
MTVICTLEIKTSCHKDESDREAYSKIATLKHENGRIIAQFLYHGPLDAVVLNCVRQQPIINGRPNIFRGELYQLAGYELLDVEKERVVEK